MSPGVYICMKMLIGVLEFWSVLNNFLQLICHLELNLLVTAL